MAREVWPSIEADYLACLLGARYIGGPAVESFEREWAAYCGARHAVGVGSGTHALQFALTALGIGPGDEVIVPSNTFSATAAAVLAAGAVPRFADVSDDTLLLTPRTLTEAITHRTRAVIPVHLYGQMADMTGLSAIAARHGLLVVEDAAQAHGAEWAGRRAGGFGAAACFSFYPAKNLGASGDAGAVVTSSDRLAGLARLLGNHGRAGDPADYRCAVVGTNSRLDALNAIVLHGKLARLEAWTRRRIALAARYRDRLRDLDVRLPGVEAQARHVYHLFVVRVGARRRVREELGRRGIQTGVHYPQPCHLQPAFQAFADRPLPVCEQAAREVMSLPLFPHMSDEQVDTVCDALGEALARVRAVSAHAS
jgi:dTDP-4-amino-4,6-dideoxygalactose transaminase